MRLFKIAVCVLAFSFIFSGCSCGRNDAEKNEKDLQQTVTSEPAETKETPSKDEKNNEVSGDNTDMQNKAEEKSSVKLYYATNSEGELNTSYHIEGCKKIETKDVMEINSDFVTMIGLNPCKECFAK